jgi:anaerobic glycerol-3-phosphate dehydrogenase
MATSFPSVITTPVFNWLRKKVPEPVTVVPLLPYVILPDRVVDQVESAFQLPGCRLVAAARSIGAGCEA